MFIEYNHLYINVSAVGWAVPNDEGRYTLYGLDGDAILDVATEEWRRAVEGALPTLPAAPGFTLVTFEIDKDGDAIPWGDYPIVGWRPAGDGTAEPVCVGPRPEGYKITAVRDAEGRVVTRFSPSGYRPYAYRTYASLDDALPEIKATAKKWWSAIGEALEQLRSEQEGERD